MLAPNIIPKTQSSPSFQAIIEPSRRRHPGEAK
jgi:hypothetical protein